MVYWRVGLVNWNVSTIMTKIYLEFSIENLYVYVDEWKIAHANYLGVSNDIRVYVLSGCRH